MAILNFIKTIWDKIQFSKMFKKREIIIFVFIFVAMGILLIPLLRNQAQAGWIGESLEWIICNGWGITLRLLFYIAACLLWLSGVLLDWILGSALDIQNLRSVELGWSLARDTVNMFFVIFLLVIAFATILRIEAYQYKALLPKLIISILLVNFSRTICAVLIEFSNVLTSAFLNFGSASGSATSIAMLMGVQSVFQLDDTFGITEIDNYTVLASFAFVVVIVLLMAFAFCGIAGMLLLRTVVLMVLIVLSPAAFVMNILPLTKKYFQQWWDAFLNFLFYAPIAAFCLYLSAVVASEARGVGNIGLGDAMSQSAAMAQPGENILPSAMSNPEFIWEFGLVIGLLCLSIMMIKEGGGMLANLAMNAAQKGFFGGAKLAGAWGRRKLASKGVGEYAKGLTGKKGKYGRNLLGWGLRGLHGAASLTYLPAAWKAQREKEEHEVSAISTGWARDRINKVFNKIPGAAQDKTKYEHGAYMDLVHEEKKRNEIENPGKGWQYLVTKIKHLKGVSGKEHEIEAAMRDLFTEKNINELIDAASTDKDLAEMLYSEKGIAARYVGSYDPEAYQDIFEKHFGKEKGRQTMLSMGEEGAKNGNWLFKEWFRRAHDNSLVSPTDKYIDPKTGKEYTREKYEDIVASERSKREIRDRVNQYRGDVNEMSYGMMDEVDEQGNKTGKKVHGEIHHGPSGKEKAYVRNVGWGGQDAYRATQMMAPQLKGIYVGKEHFCGTTDENGKRHEGMADVIRDQFNKGETEKAKSNLQFYYELGEAATMPKETQEAMKKLVKDFKIELSAPRGAVQNYPEIAKKKTEGTGAAGKPDAAGATGAA